MLMCWKGKSAFPLPDRWLSARFLRVSGALQWSHEVKLQSLLFLFPVFFFCSVPVPFIFSVCIHVRVLIYSLLHFYVRAALCVIKEQKEPVGA